MTEKWSPLYNLSKGVEKNQASAGKQVYYAKANPSRVSWRWEQEEISTLANVSQYFNTFSQNMKLYPYNSVT